MSISEQLRADLEAAIRSGDEVRKSAIRGLLSAIGYASIPAHREIAEGEEVVAAPRQLDDAAALEVIRQQIKQRHDSVDAFQKAGRPELAAKEQADLDVIRSYLPNKPFSEDELRRVVREVIAELGATSIRDMGKVMSALLPRIKDRADGRAANQIVRAELEGA